MSQPEPAKTPDAPDSAAIMKALAHPLRLRILGVMHADAPARAVDVAAELGVPANQVSFHLRTLAKAGIVAEAPEVAQDGRERFWRLQTESIDIDHSLLVDDESYRLTTAATIGAAFDLMRQLVLDRMRNDPSATQTISLSTLVSVRLTHQQAVALSERLWALIQEFHDDPEAAAALAEPISDGYFGPGPDDPKPQVYGGLLALAPLRADLNQ